MKRIKIITSLIGFGLLFLVGSCSSTKGKSTLSSVVNISIPDEYFLGEGSLCMKGFTGMDTINCTFAFDESNNQNVKVYFKYQMQFYSLTFDKTARNMLRYSVNAYLKDFDDHILLDKSSLTYNRYGISGIDTNWGSTANRMFNIAHVKMNLGYLFVKKSPYFTMTSWVTKNEVYDKGYATGRSLPKMSYFMTKAQVSRFLEIMDEDNLNLLRNKIVVEKNKTIKTDSY